MKEKDFFAALIGDSVRAKTIRLFCVTFGGCFTISDIRTRVQITEKKAQAEVKHLLGLGLIKKVMCTREVTEGKGKDKVSKKVKCEGWTIDTEHEYLSALEDFLRNTQPPTEDSLLGNLKGSGTLKLVVTTGFLVGHEKSPSKIDLLIVGEKMNERKVAQALRTVETLQGKEIVYAVFSPDDFRYRYDMRDKLIRDVIDYPHRILVDEMHVF